MGIIYDNNNSMRMNPYFHKKNGDTYDFAKFLEGKGLGLSKEQLKDLMLEFRGRNGKTKKDDALDIFKDRIYENMKVQCSRILSPFDPSNALGYILNAKDKDQKKEREDEINGLFKETDSVTEEALNDWLDKFVARTDILPLLSIDRPLDVFWYRIDNKLDTTEPNDGLIFITDDDIDYHKSITPEGQKLAVSIYNPFLWEYKNVDNLYFWHKGMFGSYCYVPEKAIFDYNWLNEPSS